MLPSEMAGLSASEAVAPTPERESDLGRADFLRMLVAQLENQDPLNPQDPSAFSAQLAQFSSLEQLIAMRTGIDGLVANLDPAGGAAALGGLSPDLLAAGVIGKEVLARGSSLELASPGQSVPIAFELDETASSAVVRILDRDGMEIAAIERERLSGGPHEMVWNGEIWGGSPAPAGVYSFLVDAAIGSRPVSSSSFTVGNVTGTSLRGGEPTLLLGGIEIPLADVLEIREPGSGR